MKEQFKDIPQFKGMYQVSNLGNVKSFKFGKERILKPSDNGSGYLKVTLNKKGYRFTRYVHQLVAMAFLGHEPCGHSKEVDHIDENSFNNKLSNIRVLTLSQHHNKNSSSVYDGVSWAKDKNKWHSYIDFKGKRKHLGHFTNELEASEAYQSELKKLNNEQVSN